MKGIKISKEKQEYYIERVNLNRGRYKEKVQGYKVTFAGYEEFEFFLHHSNGMWRVSEATTGKYICSDTHKSGLVSFAGVMIRQLSPAELKAKLAEELKLND